MDAFISHSSKDNESTKRIGQILEASGLDLWVDLSKIRLGSLLGPELQASIQACRTLVLLWSEAAAESPWVNSEWLTAFHLDRFVIPCVLDGTKLPQCLRNNVYLDLRGGFETAGEALVRGVREAPHHRNEVAPSQRSSGQSELRETIREIISSQGSVLACLEDSDLPSAATAQAGAGRLLQEALQKWPLDPFVVALEGYHSKNAYQLEEWAAIQAGRGREDHPLLNRSRQKFFEALWLDPRDHRALNGLGNYFFFIRELHAAEFFTVRAIEYGRRARANVSNYEHDVALIRGFLHRAGL